MATTQLMPEWKAAADEIWVMLNKSAQVQAETAEQMKEADKRIDNLQKTVELISENVGGLNRSMKDLQKDIERVNADIGDLNWSLIASGLNRSLTELIETLIAARFWEKFPDHNLQRSYQRAPIFDEKNRIMTDIDILLSNIDVTMAVEVKRELDRRKDVDEHLKRMELIRNHPPAEVVGKKMLGAMAGGVVDADVRRYVYESGFLCLIWPATRSSLFRRRRALCPGSGSGRVKQRRLLVLSLPCPSFYPETLG
jgi:hypothetical protein